jgi:hypothetical protein
MIKIDGSFSHLGANSFQLFNNNRTLNLIYLVDIREEKIVMCLKIKNNAIFGFYF